MIDTIELHLHGLDLHYDIVKAIDPRITRNGVSRVLYPEKESAEVDFYEKMLMKPVVNMHGLGKEIYMISWTHVKSNHKDVAVQIDWKRDCIKFNFSIPKWLYGQNIQQFVPNMWNKNFLGYDERAMKEYSVTMYKPVMKFIRVFFDKMFPNYYVNFGYLKINRIDYCFNQVFPSKKEALEYLMFQKKAQRKYSREIVKEKRNYEFGITYVSPTYYSEKIYHKGSEYASKFGDRKYHVEKNRLAKKMIYNVKALQEFADKVLRYEVTFHSRGMDLLYKTKVFRNKDTAWKNLKQDYEYMQTYRNEKGELFNPEKHKKAFRGLRKRTETGKRDGDFVEYEKLSERKKRQLRYYSKVAGRKISFYVGEDDVVEQDDYFRRWDLDTNEKNILTSKQISNRLFQVMGIRFLQMVKSYKVRGIVNYQTIIEKLKKLKSEQNYARKYYASKDMYIRHLSERQLKIVLELMQNSSLVDLKDADVISKRTYYRLCLFFKDCGLNENSRFNRVVQDNYDFNDYLDFVKKNRTELYATDYSVY